MQNTVGFVEYLNDRDSSLGLLCHTNGYWDPIEGKRQVAPVSIYKQGKLAPILKKAQDNDLSPGMLSADKSPDINRLLNFHKKKGTISEHYEQSAMFNAMMDTPLRLRPAVSLGYTRLNLHADHRSRTAMRLDLIKHLIKIGLEEEGATYFAAREMAAKTAGWLKPADIPALARLRGFSYSTALRHIAALEKAGFTEARPRKGYKVHSSHKLAEQLIQKEHWNAYVCYVPSVQHYKTKFLIRTIAVAGLVNKSCKSTKNVVANRPAGTFDQKRNSAVLSYSFIASHLGISTRSVARIFDYTTKTVVRCVDRAGDASQVSLLASRPTYYGRYVWEDVPKHLKNRAFRIEASYDEELFNVQGPNLVCVSGVALHKLSKRLGVSVSSSPKEEVDRVAISERETSPLDSLDMDCLRNGLPSLYGSYTTP